MRITALFAILLTMFGLGFTSLARAEDGDESLRAQALSLNNITGDAAITGKVRELAKDKTALRKLLAEAVAMVKEKEKDKASAFNYTGALVLARAAHVVRDTETSELFYKICLEYASKLDSTEKLLQIYLGMIGLYSNAKKYDEEIFMCRKLLDLIKKEGEESDMLETRLKVEDLIVQTLARQKKYDKALENVDELIRTNKEFSWFFVHSKANIYRQMGKPDDAVVQLKKVQTIIDESDAIAGNKKEAVVEQFSKYPLSSAYIDAGQVDKSIEVLEELQKAHPEDPTYSNDLGYVLADNDRRLDDAEKLVRKAIDLDREQRKKQKGEEAESDEEDHDNAAYLDSLAWVLYKKKAYEGARDIMLDVVKQEEAQHVEIYDHLGDIYMALGKKDEAVKTWKKGLTFDNVTPRDDARKESVKKKIEAAK
ncbi:MAG: tetratricopeptide repeat protein [Gemmataceae bacterium]